MDTKSRVMDGDGMEKVDYVFVIPAFNFSPAWVSCWTDTVMWLINNNITFKVRIGSSSLLSILRNHLISEGPELKQIEIDGSLHRTSTIPFDGQLECKKVVMLDSDILWTIEDLAKLLASPHDIVCGVYILGTDTLSIMENREGAKYITLDELNQHKEPFVIYGGGLGFTAIRLKALQEIEYPWFNITEYWFYHEGQRLAASNGEDFYFFVRARDMGIDAYCDPSIRLKHEKTKILDWHIQ